MNFIRTNMYFFTSVEIEYYIKMIKIHGDVVSGFVILVFNLYYF